MWKTLVAVLAVSLSAVPSFALAQAHLPGKTLEKPDAAGQVPRAAVTLAPYRFNDILWENDRTAHRIYSRDLEKTEPPSTSGIDAWGKSVRWPYMDRQLRTGDQHTDHGEGLDFYDVGTARGAGGLGVWHDNKLWTSRNWSDVKVHINGPDVAAFSVDYAPWPVDVDRKVWETRTFSLPMGTNFTRMVSTIRSDKPGPIVVGIGISKRKRPSGAGVLRKDLAPGRVTFFEPADPQKGSMAIALMVDPKAVVEVRQDFDNYLVLIKVEPGKPFVYYMGAAWDKGLDFHSAAEWDAYVAAQTPDFDPAN
ncbi:hypothetical protein J2X45_000770 [Caulobacter sp. BE264]|uniref:DUF4861 family protein n=1 Tax=Caulobacter sp. BE264 TaxID=2817724 RepID=UPI00285896D4|nr:DUF4861 family protein [Caulobacter sp. BE264]MDR7229707.1 hypothetical protein [Caulobacter sp. BE264]